MRGVYTAYIAISGNTAAKTLCYITATSGIEVDILSTVVTNDSNETNEQIKCLWQKIGTLGTPTATTLTPSKHEDGDQAAASTVKGNVTGSEPTYTSNTEKGAMGAPSLNGYFYQPSAEEIFTIAPSGTHGLRLINSMTSADLSVTVVFRERG